MPTRRALLATGALALTAGCLDTAGTRPDGVKDRRTGSPTDTSPDGTDDRRETSGCHDGLYVSADAIDPPQALPVDLSDAQRSLVADATDGTVEVTTYAQRPLRDGVFVRHDGRFYETGVERAASVAVPARVANLYWKQGRTAPVDATVVDFADLPASDRAALRFVVEGPEYGTEEGGHPSQELSAEQVPVPYPDGVEGSRLVGAGMVWVRWNGRQYRVEVTTEAATLTRRTFGVSLTEVADSDGQFTRVVAGRFLVVLDDLTDAQRRVLATATSGTYEECGEPSAPVEALRDRLSAHDRLPHPEDQSWFVAFEGDRYALEFVNWVA